MSTEPNNILGVEKERIFHDNFATLLQSLPFTDEFSLEVKINELLFNFENDIRVYFTSGTTQKPKALYFDSKDIGNVAEYLRWFCEVENIAGGERVAVLMDHSFWGTGHLTSLGHIAAGNSVIPVDLRSREAIAEVFNTVSPTVVSTLPSKLEEFVDVIPKENLKVLETTGEPMTKKQRIVLEKMYDAEIYDAYGLTEGVVGVECQAHDGYHYREDKAYIEIKSFNSDKIIADGRVGEIILTNLTCHTQPIIRYRTRDAGKIVRGQCVCGRTEPRLMLQGRVGKAHSLIDGAKIGEKNMQSIMQETLGFVPEYKIRVNVKKGIATIDINTDKISTAKAREIIGKISEVNFDVFNLVKTRQLKFLIQIRQHG